MTRLLLFVLLLLPFSAFAQSTPPLLPSGPLGSVNVYHSAPGVTGLYDQNRNSVMLYDTGPGQRAYTQRDSNGTVTSQGMLFEPLESKPLTVPSDYDPTQSSRTPLERVR